jgi:chromosome segregation ATPase
MTHQLADLELEIDRLKAQQTQMLQENSVLGKHLQETEELAHRSADQIRDLKLAQSQMAQDKANLAAQLKASQEQVTNLAAHLDASQAQMAKIAGQIKANQDQIARLVEQKQKQRSKPLVAASPPASGLTNGLAPKPPLQRARPQTQDPAQASTR